MAIYEITSRDVMALQGCGDSPNLLNYILICFCQCLKYLNPLNKKMESPITQ